MGNATAPSGNHSLLPRLGPVRTIDTRTLRVGYVDAGPAQGDAVLLLHGFPYDVHSYIDVIPRLVDSGLRVITPYLRGHGPTQSRGGTAATSGEQAALGADVVELLDALEIDSAVLAGFDWGGRAACVAAALWPERCAGLVSVNGYLIQDLAAAQKPLPPRLEAGFWYFWYFATERGAAGLAADPRGVAEVIWARNSPAWKFDDAMLDRAAAAFDNPDYVDVVLHSYRHRLGLAPGHARYADFQKALDTLPPIPVPAVTLDGTRDGNFPATDGAAGAVHFTGPRVHLQVPGVGHNLPQEAPDAFAGAVLEVRTIARHAAAQGAGSERPSKTSGGFS